MAGVNSRFGADGVHHIGAQKWWSLRRGLGVVQERHEFFLHPAMRPAAIALGHVPARARIEFGALVEGAVNSPALNEAKHF
jgi:hypothetical protein